LGERDGDGIILSVYLRGRMGFVHWIDLAQDRETWPLLLDTVTKLLVS
jgi:hypothetical protein